MFFFGAINRFKSQPFLLVDTLFQIVFGLKAPSRQALSAVSEGVWSCKEEKQRGWTSPKTTISIKITSFEELFESINRTYFEIRQGPGFWRRRPLRALRRYASATPAEDSARKQRLYHEIQGCPVVPSTNCLGIVMWDLIDLHMMDIPLSEPEGIFLWCVSILSSVNRGHQRIVIGTGL